VKEGDRATPSNTIRAQKDRSGDKKRTGDKRTQIKTMAKGGIAKVRPLGGSGQRAHQVCRYKKKGKLSGQKQTQLATKGTRVRGKVVGFQHVARGVGMHRKGEEEDRSDDAPLNAERKGVRKGPKDTVGNTDYKNLLG